MKDIFSVPENLAEPQDDGACDHLLGFKIPELNLMSTDTKCINVGQISDIVVYYFYPMIGDPAELPGDDWNSIPGARGCTPQSCSYRDKYSSFSKSKVRVFGVSGQQHEKQCAAKERLHLPFELLSDINFNLCDSLMLPKFVYNGELYVKRVTLIVVNGMIEMVFYPVFPSDSDSDLVLKWLGQSVVS